MKSAYTTFEIGKICHVYPTTVIKWIKKGKLKSFATPGGHRRVQREDLFEFLRTYHLPVPLEFDDNGRKRKILIVDDDLEMAELVKMTLGDAEKGWEIHAVSTGFGAGVKIFEWHPDVILLDFLMPDLDGYEVCRLLRENPKMERIPVIALTCLASAEDKQKILSCGVTDYLAKPFQKEELLQKVKKCLEADRMEAKRVAAES